MTFTEVFVDPVRALIDQRARPAPDQEQMQRDRHSRVSWFTVAACLCLACMGTSWFAYQCFFVAQLKDFEPVWKAARWIQATDGTAPVVYFYHTTSIATVPDMACLTIAGSQTFRLYVNKTFIGTNEADFFKGDVLRPDVYDVAYALKPGPNTIVIRVANLDQQAPMVRANLHLVVGPAAEDYGTGTDWMATTKSNLVYPGDTVNLRPIGTASDNASVWPQARLASVAPKTSALTVNPHMYEQPLPRQWLSASGEPQAYFIRQLTIPAPLGSAWLRFAATGQANIFVNGNLFVSWTGKPPSFSTEVIGSLGYLDPGVKMPSKRVVGVYDLAPYLHTGSNTIAVYVSASKVSGTFDHSSASMLADMLMSDGSGHDHWDETPGSWRAADHFIPQWQQNFSLMHDSPIAVASPVLYRQLYLLDSSALLQRSNSLRSTQALPWSLLGQLLPGCCVLVCGLWFAMACIFGRRYYGTWQNAFMVMSLAYLPALAYEAFMITLTREPLLSGPFPYQWQSGVIMLLLVFFAYLVLWLYGRWRMVERNWLIPGVSRSMTYSVATRPSARPVSRSSTSSPAVRVCRAIGAWLRQHWTLVPLVLLATFLIFSALTYEPYWQDELVSYYVSKNSLSHGFPTMPSGFLYPKAELFAYMLGLIMRIFGDQGMVPRLLSALEFILSIPLLYFVGKAFFGRHVGWLAAAMLALSPFALVWGAQLRMYEQAQLCVLCVFAIFYKAARQSHNKRLPYLAVACLIVTYLSHEETFIILPGLVLCVFMVSREPNLLLPGVCYRKHWWLASLAGAGIIALQLLFVRFSHPPVLGTDQSMRPDIQLNMSGLPFYVTLLFSPKPTATWLTINSLLASAGCVWALWSKDGRLRYCTLFLCAAFVTLVFLFTLQADRYFYPLLPVYYLVGAYVVVKLLHYAWNVFRSCVALPGHEDTMVNSSRWLPWPIHFLARSVVGLVYACILIAPMLPISNYTLGVSRVLGLSYHRHFADYDLAGQYIQQHWQKGDIIISISPDIEMYYYVGQSDYYFSIDRALFLIEQHGHIVNTSTAAIALLNQQDFQAVLARHARVWLVSDHSQYEIAALRRFTFPADFHVVFEGARGIVYLRGG